MKKIIRIVITGKFDENHCPIKDIKEAVEQTGYKVIIVPRLQLEADNRQWIQKQLKQEKKALLKAKLSRAEKILIICDGGAIDYKVLNKDSFEDALKVAKTNEIHARDTYDGAFIFCRSKKLRNFEKALIYAWTGQPHLRVAAADTNKLIEEVMFLLGEPESLEIERKYLIEYPDIPLVERLSHCRKVEISQTYLEYPDRDKIRIRRRGCNGNYIYFRTYKKRINEITNIEIEERLTEKQYYKLLNDETAEKCKITKDRYCLTYKGQYFEIDIFPFWDDRAFIEIELKSEDQEIEFPYFLTQIKEVSDDNKYTNFALAKRMAELSKEEEEDDWGDDWSDEWGNDDEESFLL